MYVVNNSLRALLVALIPIGVAHALMTAMALLGGKGMEAEPPAPDQVLTFYLTRVAIDGGLLFAGHRMLRQRMVSSRAAYALMGGAMAAIGYAIALRNSFELSPAIHGTALTIGLLPAIAGMLSGFLYGQFAGLSPAARFPTLSYEGLVTSLAFDGPTRVRTSVAGIVIAAVMPAVLTTILSATVVSLLPTYFNYLTGGPGPALGPIVAAAIPAQLFLTILVGTIVPAAVFVLCLHHIARALRRHRAREYAALGGAMALICAYLLVPLTPFTSVSYLLIPAAGCGAIMGALYRRFAGLEPLPLPEAVIANDPDALVGADHPARRQHNVILSN
ncbi:MULTISPECIES: hypothetical protein [unclassified Bradyrhizobium]|uniref:hypothetical protein n=1 Tax=unclassified Bradyrhizobium TaxID=2631580 RepID=UPI0028E678CE|nr:MULTISPECIES: hypothetical protein [unclassified Bradyrhizobium]